MSENRAGELEVSFRPGEISKKDKHIEIPNSPNGNISSEINPKHVVYLGVKILLKLHVQNKFLQIIIRSHTHKSQEKLFYYFFILFTE